MKQLDKAYGKLFAHLFEGHKLIIRNSERYIIARKITGTPCPITGNTPVTGRVLSATRYTPYYPEEAN